MIHTPQRMRSLTPHFFASLSSRIAAFQANGADVIRLDEGSPDLPPAPHIISALIQSASEPGSHTYQPHRGTADLRSSWARMYRQVFQAEVDAETEVLPLIGSKEGIFHFGLACVEAGDIVLVPDPGYISFTRGAQVAGAQVFPVPLRLENSYLPDLDAIPVDILRQARLLWLNYPNNPTGATVSPEFLTHAVEFARQHVILLCHDAAYTQVTFEDYHAPSVLQVPGARDVAVEFNSLSKSHNMAGWRVGAVLGNAEVLRRLHTLKTNADSGHFLPVIQGAVAALTGDQGWIQERNKVYQARRDVVISALLSLGLNPRIPRASIYVWCPTPGNLSSIDFAQAVLERAHVSLTPGVIFGDHGEGYVRISLTVPATRLEEAMHRITSMWDTLAI